MKLWVLFSLLNLLVHSRKHRRHESLGTVHVIEPGIPLVGPYRVHVNQFSLFFSDPRVQTPTPRDMKGSLTLESIKQADDEQLILAGSCCRSISGMRLFQKAGQDMKQIDGGLRSAVHKANAGGLWGAMVCIQVYAGEARRVMAMCSMSPEQIELIRDTLSAALVHLVMEAHGVVDYEVFTHKRQVAHEAEQARNRTEEKRLNMTEQERAWLKKQEECKALLEKTKRLAGVDSEGEEGRRESGKEEEALVMVTGTVSTSQKMSARDARRVERVLEAARKRSGQKGEEDRVQITIRKTR